MTENSAIQGPPVSLPLRASFCVHAIVVVAVLCALTSLIGLGGCGGSNSSTPPPQSVTVTVSSSSSNVLLGNTQQLTATVTGTSNTAVTWSVNGISGGNPLVGTISSTGLFTAPQDLPKPANATIQATSVADTSASGNAVLTIASDINVKVTTSPPGMAIVFPGGSVQLLATLVSAGHPDPTVNWAVNGVANGNSALGTITAAGPGTAWYNAPTNAAIPASVNITANCVADSSKSKSLVEAIQSCTLNGTIGYAAPAPYVPPSGSTCDVSDVNSLDSCVAAVRSGGTPNVRFTTMVNCSGNNTCLVDLSDIHGPITFFGAAGVTAGFLRTDTYTYSILNLNGASDITFANLTFDEGPADPACAPYQSNGSEIYPCDPTIFILNSSSILFEQVIVLHSKQNGIAFAATQGIAIQDSLIQDAGVFGIWTDQEPGLATSGNISITNNLIQDVKSNGIFISYAQNGTIKGNTLKHNQYLTVFDTCGGGCAGGQIYMLNANSMQIYSNQIIDGQIDLNNATGQTDGIEISNQNTNVLITNNEITNNLGGGIDADPGTSGTNFVITGNKINNNGANVNLVYATGVQEFGDCFTQ
ncbi:MAG: right-handed parallel beta-helix repeat-containing protein [Candidatus Acidiferrum sp.]